MTPDLVSLEDAVRMAVDEGRTEVAGLDAVVNELAATFARVPARAGAASPSLARLGGLVEGIPHELRGHLDYARESLGSFNVAFFGRTGVGKSTLLSAFGQLDGGYVSPGASDWTTKIGPIDWHGCRLYDTPGINGWGRTERRDDLEAEARRAVEIADVVLLCFDNQSQQSMEFEKIAAWVSDFGKPVVAVLNIRNPLWRHPAQVPEKRRRHLSDSVRQHHDNIRTELTQIGLPDTPIVAIHSKRALFARASTPFRGPAGKELLHERDEFGTDYLARWSNFGTLEQLIAASIKMGAAKLRRHALRADLRSRCHRAIADLEALKVEIEEEAKAREREVEDLFAVLGYPGDVERATWLHDSGTDLVDLSETARGRPYTSADRGTLDRYVRYLTDSHLAGCRRKAQARADDLIHSAFDEGTSTDDAAFRKSVFDEDAVEAAVKLIWADRRTFLQRELEIAVAHDPARSDVTATHTATILGAEGGGILGKAVQGGGIAVGLGALAIPLLVTPVGWGIVAAMAGVGIVGQVQQMFGKKISDQADERKRKARAQAVADSHRAVDQTFDDYESVIVRESRSAAWKFLDTTVSESLRDAVELRTALTRITTLVAAVRDCAASVGTTSGVTDVLSQAQAQIAASPTALMRTLLGEDWLGDTEDEYRPAALTAAVQEQFVRQHEDDTSRLRHAICAAWTAPSPARLRSWQDKLEDAARSDFDLYGIAHAFRGFLHSKPAITVLGDYNTGKSSLIRRILVENDLSSPGSIDIRAVPATATAQRFEFPRFDLVDTPGLQSGSANHDAIALEAVVEAALVIVVVHINLLVGNPTLLEQIAQGSDTLAAKGERMLFLINRCDELGVNPLAAPDAYLNLQHRKRDELRSALASRAIEVDADRIHCLSGNPHGLVENDLAVTARDFDENRPWDGVAALTEAIKALPDDQLPSASAAAAFDAAVTALKRHNEGLRQRRDTAMAEARNIEPMIAVLRTALDDAAILASSLHEDARRIVDGYATTAKSTAHEISRKDSKRLENLLGSWWSDPQLETDLQRYLSGAATSVDEWYSEHTSAIGRESRAAQFRLSHDITEGFHAAGTPLYEEVAEGAGKAAGGIAPLVRAVGNRDAVYAIGKQFGHKFKPWGAVKGGAKVAKVGNVLAVVGAAVDVAAMANDVRKSNEHKDQQHAAEHKIDEQAAEMIESIARGQDGTGPLSYIEQQKSQIERLLAEYDGIKSSINERIVSTSARVAVVEDLLKAADDLTDTQRSYA